MLPEFRETLRQDFEVVTKPSRTWQLQQLDTRLYTRIDTLESVKQMCYCILNTERYQYMIYSWNFGIELADLFGKAIEYVLPELTDRITNALMQDDRVLSVSNFEYTIGKGTVLAEFDVETVFGSFVASKEVSV